MAVVQGAELVEMIVDGGESAKDLKRPGMQKLLAAVEAKQAQAVIVAKLDRLTRSVKDLGELLERFEKRGVALVSAVTIVAIIDSVCSIIASAYSVGRPTTASRTTIT